MLHVFVDWAVKKDFVALIWHEEKKEVVHFKMLEGLFAKTADQECAFFLEAGASRGSIIFRLLKRGKVFLVPGIKVKEFRERTKTKKSDVADVKALAQLYAASPEAFREVAAPEKEVFRFRMLLSEYRHLTKDLVRLKNRAFAYQREFGNREGYDVLIKQLAGARTKLVIEITPYVKPIVERLRIKGVGIVNLGLVLAQADPTNFTSLSAYLQFCGYSAKARYKDPAKGFVKGNLVMRRSELRSACHQLGESVIRAKDKTWYPFYTMVKSNLKGRHPDASKLKIDQMAKNRLATFLLKEVYHVSKSKSK